MKIFKLSDKQAFVNNWWNPPIRVFRDKKGIIVDGAMRSGKTFSAALSFFRWANTQSDYSKFLICGDKLYEDIINPLAPILSTFGFTVESSTDKNFVDVKNEKQRKVHRFYLLSPCNEHRLSQLTDAPFSGILFDGVTDIPRSLVEYIMANCTDSKTKYWFTSRTKGPYHWFYNEWIRRKEEKNLLYISFQMVDNPALSNEKIAQCELTYTGPLLERYMFGQWCPLKGPVYPMFDPIKHTRRGMQDATFEKYYLSYDYGTINPFSLGLWGYNGRDKIPEAARIKEFYYDSRKQGRQLTDEEYYTELKKLAHPYPIEVVVIEPSAASFIETISRHGEFCVIKADNDVLAGIDAVCNALKNNRICIDDSCTDTLREFSQYCWDSEARRDTPKKENDHAMDDIRFFVKTILTDREAEKQWMF